MFFPAAFKAKARDALRQHWQTALLIALIVNLPSLLVQGIAAFTNNDPLTRVQDLMIRAYSSQTAMNTLQDSILKLFSETGILVMLVERKGEKPAAPTRIQYLRLATI